MAPNGCPTSAGRAAWLHRRPYLSRREEGRDLLLAQGCLRPGLGELKR